MRYEFRSSAFRHGLGEQDILAAWTRWIKEIIENDDPFKVTRIGFGTSSALPLEITAEISEDDTVVFFHAMPARTKYLTRFGKRTR